jgi:hypothetical protein
MPSLFEEGWRQGSLLKTSLTVRSYDLADDTLTQCDQEFGLWAVVTQDCDLHSTQCTNQSRQIELRPVFPSAGIRVDGIRSRAACITPDFVLKADSQKLTMTARALNSLKKFRDNSVDDLRRREIKAWLGLRYDRPAVPEPFDRMASDILYPGLYDAMPPALIGRVRDILVLYESETEVRLWAILRDADDRIRCLDWIDGVAQSLVRDHGITVLERQAEDSRRTPYAIVEGYHGLNSAELSRGGPENQ